ncbi:MAG: ABC transporter substrate-binding protein [Fimbriimonas sp.]|nr:ABC transporter substrate-binding protein [Fimbriimonas sp.]
MRINFLSVLFVICLVLTGVKLFSGGGSLVSRKTEVSFWNGWTGPDGIAMLEVIRQFNEENPDIEVSMQRMAWDTYYNKLMVSAMSGRGPQVFVIHASTLPRMVRAGYVGDVSDLFGPSTGISPSDFESKVLDQVKFGNQMVGVPLDIHPQGLYCNRDLFVAAGLTNPDGSPKPPTTKDEFIADIRKLQKIGPTGDHDVWGFSWTFWRNNFMALVPQFHGRYFDENGKPDLINPGNVAALTFMGDLMNHLKLTPPAESNAGWTGFRQKKVAMLFEGVYMVGDLQSLTDFHYFGAQVPKIGDQPGTVGDSHCLCIRADLSPKEREASERFIKYLSKHSLAWAKAGQVPARISIRNSEEFKKLQVQYAYSKEVPYMVYPPRTPLLFELIQEIDQAVERVLRGDMPPKKALEIANGNVASAIERDKQENKT